MNSVQFSVIATGETVERQYDSTGFQFRDKVIGCKPVTTVTLSPSEARKLEQWKEQKLQAIMDYRAKRAKPIRYGKKALQAIDYLLGDKYRDNRTPSQRREDEEVRKMDSVQFMAYMDRAQSNLVKQILGDRETVEAIRKWLASPTCSVDGRCERATYADMQREVMA